MESLVIELSPEKFDKAAHGGFSNAHQLSDIASLRVLPEVGDLAIYVKPNATVNGNPMAVITFTVQLPDGSFARAQAVTTAALLVNALSGIRGWIDGGHLQPKSPAG